LWTSSFNKRHCH